MERLFGVCSVMPVVPSSDHHGPVRPPGSALEAIEALARECDAIGLADEAAALAERVAQGRFYVAVVGQFKRGKSTLVNALVGDKILPTGVVPVTSVVTVLRQGSTHAARIRLADGAWREIAVGELAAYVSEEANHENTKGVTGVEVFVPSPLLASGMCLVDTPGLGSVFTAGTEATRAFVPHIDAALVVLGADPPMTEDELALVEEVSRHVREIVVVFNKADRVSDAERQEAKIFTERVLTERLGHGVGRILEVSATEMLAGKGERRDGGLLYDTLARLATDAGGVLVASAEVRGCESLAARLGHAMDEAIEALQRPVAESERRVEELRRCAADAEQSMGDLGYLLTAEQDRLRKRFEQRTAVFLQRTVGDARREVSEGFRACEGRGASLRSHGVTLAQEIARRHLDTWCAAEQPHAEALYQQAARRFVELANQFLARLVASGDPGLANLATAIEPEIGFRVKSRLYYTELWSLTAGTPGTWFVDLFRSRDAMLRAMDQSVGDYLERLLMTNATRIENDFNDRVLESRRRLESELRARFKELYASADRALDRARTTRAAGEHAVQRETDALIARRLRVSAITKHRP